jgi:hypothetical protein
MTGGGRRFLGTINLDLLEVVVPIQAWVRLIAGALAAAGAIVTWKSTSDKRSKWGEGLADRRRKLGQRVNDAFERTLDIDDAESERRWEMLETVVRSALSPSKSGSGDIAQVVADYKALGDGQRRPGRHNA